MNADAALIQGAETEGSQRGEFLLVLGNRELYCVLLILIVQFALVFRLGYMAGQASPVSAAAKSRANAPKISAAKAGVRHSATVACATDELTGDR